MLIPLGGVHSAAKPHINHHKITPTAKGDQTCLSPSELLYLASLKPSPIPMRIPKEKGINGIKTQSSHQKRSGVTKFGFCARVRVRDQVSVLLSNSHNCHFCSHSCWNLTVHVHVK